MGITSESPPVLIRGAVRWRWRNLLPPAEVTRILNREQWPVILAARQQAETVMHVILFVVAVFAGVAVLSRKV